METHKIDHVFYLTLSYAERRRYKCVWQERSVFCAEWLDVPESVMRDYNFDFGEFTDDRDADVETQRFYIVCPSENFSESASQEALKLIETHYPFETKAFKDGFKTGFADCYDIYKSGTLNTTTK